MINRTNWMGSS